MERKNQVKTIQQAHQNFNRNDMEAATKDIADNITTKDHGRGITANNRKEHIQLLKSWKQAFSDGQIAEPTYIEGGGDKVITLFSGRGTNDGPFGDFPPTGKKVDVPMCEVIQFNEEGQVVAGELYFDRMTMLEQLGLGLLEKMAKQ